MISKSYIAENDNNFLIKNNSILFYGENLGLKDFFKRKIKFLNKSYKFINLVQDDIIQNQDFLFGEINNASLFEDKKIFFIDQINDKSLIVIEPVLKNIYEHKIILFADLLEKKSKVRNFYEKSEKFHSIACYPDNEISLRKIVEKTLKDFEGLNTYNINLILQTCNMERSKVYNEIDKIKLFFSDKKLDAEKLLKLLNVRENENFDLLRDKAFIGDKSSTNRLLGETIIDPDKNIYYLNVINQRLIKLKEVRDKIQNNEIEEVVNNLKPPVFWKDKPKLIMQAKKWSTKKATKMLNETFDLEKRLKSDATINKTTLLKKLMIDICCVANS